jgi:hypothetical protein
MLLQEPKSAGIRARFNPLSEPLRVARGRSALREVNGEAERFLRDVALALTLTRRIKSSIFAEKHVGL